jgi:hypothetical protein|uniref:hypothetical protein n=1 Tax=uncultured Sphingomonas sp. TaxID=158754 RepID=UPI0035C97474
MSGKTLRNLAIALAVGGGLYAALIFAELSAPGLQFGGVKVVMPLVLGSALFANLNRLAGNRRMAVANDERKAELLAFPTAAGAGWIVVMRDTKGPVAKLGMDVSVDGIVVAQLLPRRFTMIAVSAGLHRLDVEVPGAQGDFAVTPYEVAVAAGEILIFGFKSSMGVMRSALTVVPVADTPAVRTKLAGMALVEPQ